MKLLVNKKLTMQNMPYQDEVKLYEAITSYVTNLYEYENNKYRS